MFLTSHPEEVCIHCYQGLLVQFSGSKMSRKRSYNENFLSFGFPFLVSKGLQVPQCVACQKTLATESMEPFKFKLNEHLEKVHPDLANKGLDYFKIKEDQLKRSRLDHGTGVLFQVGV